MSKDLTSEYNRAERIYPCKLTKNDVIKLFDLLAQGLPKNVTSGIADNGHHVEFSVSASFADKNISTTHINKLLEAEGLPDELDDLYMSSHEYVPGAHVKLTTVNFGPSFFEDYSNFSVQGQDEIWVRGKREQISDFFKEKRVWYWFIKNRVIGNL